VIILSKEYVKWIVLANVLAWPAAYVVMNQWLKNFAYRTDIRIGIFFLSAVLALVIALLTVSFQSIKAALTDPVESLRYE
jgi:putative ABC transport system permease protein